MTRQLLTTDPEDLCGTEEAGRMLGVSAREIRNKIKRGKIPARRVGHGYVMHRSAVLAYVKLKVLKRRLKAQGKR